MDCLFNRRIPMTTSSVYIIKPASKTWINGIPRSYEIEYDPVFLSPYITERQYERLILTINDVLFSFAPCDLCFCFGYLCCLCTAGLSFLCPYLCMRDAERELLKIIKDENRDLKKVGLQLTLRKKCSTSWLELRIISLS